MTLQPMLAPQERLFIDNDRWIEEREESERKGKYCPLSLFEEMGLDDAYKNTVCLD